MSDRNDDKAPCARTPKMYIWAREVLFLGSCHARQQARRATQDKFILALKGTLKVRTAKGRTVTTRSCLIPSGQWIDRSVLDAGNAVVAIDFLPPFAQDYDALSASMKVARPGVYYDHTNEDAARRAAIDIRNTPGVSPAQARERFRAPLFPPEIAHPLFRQFDHRVIYVARRIRESLLERCTLSDLAAEVYLSSSRLEKLFKDQTGLPITQYRMRYRVFISTILIALGYSMTDAALAAGFSNSAHLSRSYRALNGITPSAVFLRPPYLEPVIDSSALELVASLTEGTVAV